MGRTSGPEKGHCNFFSLIWRRQYFEAVTESSTMRERLKRLPHPLFSRRCAIARPDPLTPLIGRIGRGCARACGLPAWRQLLPVAASQNATKAATSPLPDPECLHVLTQLPADALKGRRNAKAGYTQAD